MGASAPGANVRTRRAVAAEPPDPVRPHAACKVYASAVAAAFILLAAVLEAVKAFSPAPQSEQAAEAETAEEERAEQSADAPEEAVQADGAVEAAEEQTAGESAEDADRPQGE